jgi:hypothetical protein
VVAVAIYLQFFTKIIAHRCQLQRSQMIVSYGPELRQRPIRNYLTQLRDMMPTVR